MDCGPIKKSEQDAIRPAMPLVTPKHNLRLAQNASSPLAGALPWAAIAGAAAFDPVSRGFAAGRRYRAAWLGLPDSRPQSSPPPLPRWGYCGIPPSRRWHPFRLHRSGNRRKVPQPSRPRPSPGQILSGRKGFAGREPRSPPRASWPRDLPRRDRPRRACVSPDSRSAASVPEPAASPPNVSAESSGSSNSRSSGSIRWGRFSRSAGLGRPVSRWPRPRPRRRWRPRLPDRLPSASDDSVKSAGLSPATCGSPNTSARSPAISSFALPQAVGFRGGSGTGFRTSGRWRGGPASRRLFCRRWPGWRRGSGATPNSLARASQLAAGARRNSRGPGRCDCPTAFYCALILRLDHVGGGGAAPI